MEIVRCTYTMLIGQPMVGPPPWSLTWRAHEPLPPQAPPTRSSTPPTSSSSTTSSSCFAVTQVSHLLLDDLTWHGAGRSLLVLLVVWWAWNYTTWVTNELDPDAIVVRLLVLAIMLASLVMAVAIPEAFGSRALLFVGAYVAIQVGRHAFLTFVVADRGSPEREPALHILIWFVAAGVFWIAGGLVDGPARIALWLVALAIDYSAPLVLYRVPGRAQARPSAWEVETPLRGAFPALHHHRARRVDRDHGRDDVRARSSTSPGSTAFGARVPRHGRALVALLQLRRRIAQRRLELASDRTTLARDGYTYLHVVFVAGIIVAAVGDELVIAHPTESCRPPSSWRSSRARSIYLLAHVLFRLRMAGSLSGSGSPARSRASPSASRARSRCARRRALIVACWWRSSSPSSSGARRRERGEPSPLQRLEGATAPSAPRAE